MKVIVCVSQVSRIVGPSGLNPSAGKLDPASLVRMLNPADEVAVEEALRVRELGGSGTVAVVTVAPEGDDEALKWALAMGADEAFHLTRDGEQMVAWQVAAVLAGFISRRPCDLILLGKQTVDHGSAQVGPFVAELLDLPLVTGVVKTEYAADGRTATVEKTLERGDRAVVETPLPAVLTVEKGLNRPRYPTVPGRNRGSREVINVVDGAAACTEVELALPGIKLVKLAPPRLKAKKILAPDSNLSPAAKLQFMMRGGMAEKKGGAVGGDPAQLASGIIEFLRERNFLLGK